MKVCLSTLRVGYLILAPLLGGVGCHAPEETPQVVNVSMANTDLYQQPLVGGDEEGARITAQAKHSSLCDIRRDSTTHFFATFRYRPATGFVGSAAGVPSPPL